jgi:hypothetical protein
MEVETMKVTLESEAFKLMGYIPIELVKIEGAMVLYATNDKITYALFLEKT